MPPPRVILYCTDSSDAVDDVDVVINEMLESVLSSPRSPYVFKIGIHVGVVAVTGVVVAFRR